MSIALVFISLSLMADTPPAPGTTAVVTPTPAAVDKKADPTICRTYDELGSRIAQKRICKKASEWALDDADAKGERIYQLNRMRSNGPPGG